MERVITNTENLKHQYAWDEYGNAIHISEAKEYLHGKKCRYYLFNDNEYELILKAVNSGKVRSHFAIKTNYVEHNGKRYHPYSESESPDHYDAKLKIVSQGFFNWSGYKIPVFNLRLERRYSKSYFRADLIGELKSGEEIFIEIVKTSDTSQKKERFIVENQLPTFKIKIDGQGNYITDGSDFIGNREIESIRARYRSKLREFERSESEKSESWKSYYRERKRIDEEIQRLEERLRSKIEVEERKLPTFCDEAGRDYSEIESIQRNIRSEIEQVINESRKIKGSIEYIEEKSENQVQYQLKYKKLKQVSKEWKIRLYRLHRLLSGNGLNLDLLKSHKDKIDYFD